MIKLYTENNNLGKQEMKLNLDLKDKSHNIGNSSHYGNYYIEVRTLGCGAFGRVVEAKHRFGKMNS